MKFHGQHTKPRSVATAEAFWIVAIVAYGLFSSPFPSKPGPWEALVGVFLLVAASSSIFSILQFREIRIALKSKLIYFFGILVFVYYASVPFIVGIVRSWALVDIVRDALPLAYLFLFIVVAPLVAVDRLFVNRLAFALAVCGFSMGVRFIVETGLKPELLGLVHFDDEGNYFVYDPSILFSGAYFACIFIDQLRSRKIARAAFSVLGVVVSIICIAAVVQRAQLALIGLVPIIYWLSLGKKGLVFGLAAFGLALFFGSVYLSSYTSVYDAFERKFQEVGAKGKVNEAGLVFDQTAESVGKAFVGAGWGALIKNPVYRKGYSSATHSLLTYYFAKTGVVGVSLLFIIIMYMAFRSRLALSGGAGSSVLLAAWGAIFVGLFFQPSYKTLTYGFIFSLIISVNMFFVLRKEN